jgi:hypothetical protein
VHVERSRFKVVDIAKNRQLRAKGYEDDLLRAWRTSLMLWGMEPSVVVTCNPRTATRQRYAFEQKLLRLLEIKLERGGGKLSATEAMESMHALHACLLWRPGSRKAERRLEEPSEKQAAILRALGYKITNGVLQKAHD